MRIPRNKAVIAAFCLTCAHFLALARDGLWAYFTPDDMMNLHGYWTTPVGDLFLGNVLFFSPAYRPLGGLVYTALFGLFGFNPVPFRILCIGLLVGNLFLFYFFVRRIGASREASLLATLIGSYHARFADLYRNTGTLYDILCFSFYFLALGVYAAQRGRGRALGGWKLVGFALLYLAALNSKEMAVTLPLALAALEFFCFAPSAGDSLPAARKNLAAFAVAGLMTLIYAVGKTSPANPLMSHHHYAPTLSPLHMVAALRHYLDTLFYTWEIVSIEEFTPRSALLLVAGMAAAAWVLREPLLKFAGVFAILSMLPVLVITPRSGFVLYIPMAGWSLYAAVLLVRLRRRLVRWAGRHVCRMSFAPCKAAHPVVVSRTMLFVLILLFLLVVHHAMKPAADRPLLAGSSAVRELAEYLKGREAPPAGARILVRNDISDEWTPLFVARLVYRDPSLHVRQERYLSVTELMDTPWDLCIAYQGAWSEVPDCGELNSPQSQPKSEDCDSDRGRESSLALGTPQCGE